MSYSYSYSLLVREKGKKTYLQDYSIWNAFDEDKMQDYLDENYPDWEDAELTIRTYNSRLEHTFTRKVRKKRK